MVRWCLSSGLLPFQSFHSRSQSWFIEKGFFSGTSEKWFLLLLSFQRGERWCCVWLCGILEQNCLWIISGSVLLVLFLFYFTIHYRLVLSCNINTSCFNNGALSTGVSVINRSFIVILFTKLVIDRQSTELLFATLFCKISSMIVHKMVGFFFAQNTT